MSVNSNVTVSSSNANVYLYSVSGIVSDDCVVTNSVPRGTNIRVVKVYASGNVVQVSGNIITTLGETVTFQKLVSNVGLYATNTIPSAFLKASPAYTTNVDPRLPNYDFLTDNLTIWSNAEIAVSNISLFPSPSNITSNSFVYANTFYSNGAPINTTLLIPVSNINGLIVGDRIVTANIPSSAESTIQRVFSNASVLIQNLSSNANIQISSGEVCYFYPKNFSYRNLKTTNSSTLSANVLILVLESVDDIRIGSLAAHPNILASVTDDSVTTVKKIFRSNSSILIQNIDANLQITAGDYVEFSTRPTVGAVRVRGEVIWYEKAWTANSRLTNLTRNVGGTINSTINGNIQAGNLVSILGLQSVSS